MVITIFQKKINNKQTDTAICMIHKLVILVSYFFREEMRNIVGEFFTDKGAK